MRLKIACIRSQGKYHAVNARFGVFRTNRRQLDIVGLEAEMRQDSARRLHSVDPCEGLIIVAVRLVWRIPQCLDNPEWHTVKRVKNLVGQSDNIGRIRAKYG